VFILDDQEGNPGVIRVYSLIVDPNLTYDSLKELGSKLNLPTVWKFRVKVLEQKLTIRAVDGIAHIMQDYLEKHLRFVCRWLKQLQGIAGLPGGARNYRL
jgi:hypothetical protein